MESLPLPIAAFFAGLISFLSPCVLPLVPGYISLISGTGVDELKQADARLTRSVMRNSLMFIVGFSLVFVALGAVASGVGQLVSEHIAFLTKVAGVIVIVFGLHQMGLVPIRALYADKRLHGISGGGTPTGSFLVGFSFAFGWAPCVGPILGAVLALAASESTLLNGVGLLLLYSLGLALPFLATSLCIDRFLAFYSKFRRHLRKLQVVSGVLLVIIGVLIFTRHFVLLSSWLNQIPLFRSLAETFL
jgi:cytochrome c-type biogenesis protein